MRSRAWPVLLLLPALALAQTVPAHHDDGSEDDKPAPSAAPFMALPTSSAPRPAPHVSVPEKEGMLLVPAARLLMGAEDKTAAPNERPRHGVDVRAFWIDKTEVTVGVYAACVEARVCARPAKTSRACTFDLGDASLPVSCVHWHDAATYCRFAKKRLPHEAEWELAARGTSSAAYPWGGGTSSCFHAITLLKDNSGKGCVTGHPRRVGSLAAGASPYGLVDMSGNVEEWVEDWYVEKPTGTRPTSGASHVLRGGGWLSSPSASRATSRNWGSAMEAGPNVGFRCARDP